MQLLQLGPPCFDDEHLGFDYTYYIRPTTLLDLPVNSLVQICSELNVRDLARLEASCSLLRYAVQQRLADYRVLSLQDQPAAVVQPFLTWAAASGKLDNLACLRISGSACKALLDVCARSLHHGITLWPHLQHLHLTYCRALKDAHIRLITAAWPALSTLNLAGCVNLTDAALQAAADALTLVQLDCSNWMYCTDAGVAYLAARQPALQHVALDGCTRITSAAPAALALHCPTLRTLSASNCWRLCDAALAALSGHPTLTTLKLQQCPKLSALHALAACPALATLDVTGCPFVTDATLLRLLPAAGPALRHLALSGCVGVTGAALPAIAAHCPALLSLNLSRLELSDPHLLLLAAAAPPSLQHLTLDWCSSLSDASLVPLAKACPALASLSIEGVYNATDALLRALATHCRGLQALNIRTCLQFSARTIVALAAAVRLRTLQLGGIISDRSLAFLAFELRRRCPGCQVCF